MSVMNSRSCTMLGCWCVARILISRVSVLGKPSSSWWGLIFFSATRSPVRVSRAMYTLPYVPSPILVSSTYEGSRQPTPQLSRA